MKGIDTKKLLIVIIAAVFLLGGASLQAKEVAEYPPLDPDSNPFNLREIYYKSPLELAKSSHLPLESEDCSVVFVGCNELNG